MADKTGLYGSVAPLRNVGLFVQLVGRVQAREHGLPGLAAFYGPSGFGKSIAGSYGANHYQAYCVQMKSVWRPKKLCEAILTDLGLKPARVLADMVDQVAEHLARTQRPLIIDEADHLVAGGMIEVVRDIYESSGATIVLIGEERLPQSLAKWERVHGRMLEWVAAQPAEARDVTLLAAIYCPGVELSEDLKDALFRASKGSIRRICVNLSKVGEFAKVQGRASLTAADWKGAFHSGEAPAPRRGLAA